jgi:hypothetical protein
MKTFASALRTKPQWIDEHIYIYIYGYGGGINQEDQAGKDHICV